MGRDWSSFQIHKVTEIYPGVILGGLRDLDDILAMKPDVLVPLDRLPGTVWEDGFRGEILYMPIVDESILPESVLEFFVEQLLERICDKRRIAIFCIGGHGRTGYIASCLLYRLGIKDPITYIRKNYSLQAVETEEQEDAVQAYCRDHQPCIEKEKIQDQLRLRLTLSLEDPVILRYLGLRMTDLLILCSEQKLSPGYATKNSSIRTKKMMTGKYTSRQLLLWMTRSCSGKLPMIRMNGIFTEKQ